ncbi:MAG: hypothetical protein KDA87_18845, partial [Planctomycetales bacterium]|nr:hypothetical protein [Planctomycetales bacterium]
MNWKMIWFAIWPLAVCGCSGSKTEVTPVSANHISDVTREREHIDDATDFDLAIREVNFDPLGDANGEAGENGIPDSVEMALVAHILSCPELDLSSQNGVCYRDVQAAWEQAYASARQDIQVHMQQWPHLPTLIAGYVMVGTPDSFKAVDRMTTSFGTPLRGDYSAALALGHHLGPEGDADGDGFTNRQEYHAFGRQDRTQYVNAALSATIIPDSPQADLPKPKKTRRT